MTRAAVKAGGSRATLLALGALSLLFFAWHAVDLVVFHNAPHDLWWACNVAPPVLAVGCLAKQRQLVAITTLWLFYGAPMWALDIATGGELMVSSIPTHVGCPVIGVLAIRRLGWPRNTWYKATAALLLLQLLTRLVTPPEFNVNLAFAVWAGWEPYFPSYRLYFVVLLASGAATFLLTELLLVRLLTPRRPPAETT